MEDKMLSLIDLKNRLHKDYERFPKDIIEIGDYTYGVPNILYWDKNTKLSIGKFCSIAENVTIVLGGEHRVDWISTYPFNALLEEFSYIQGHPATKGDIRIGNDVWIGSGVKILSGVEIGDGVVIGANSVVSCNIEPYTVVIGNPLRIVKKRFNKKLIKNLLTNKWWELDERYLIEIIPLLQSAKTEELIDYVNKLQ